MAESQRRDRDRSEGTATGSAVLRYVAWVPGDRFGGCEAYAVAVAAYARARDWEVTLLCPHRACAAECRRRLPGVRVIRWMRPVLPAWLPGREKLFRIWETILGFLYLVGSRPDVVHCVLPWHIHSIGFIQTCTWLRVPTLVTIQLAAANSPPPRQYLDAFRRARAAGVTFCAISDNNRRLVAGYYGFAPGEVALIPNRPSQSPPVALTSAQRQEIRVAIGVGADDYMIFTAAHLHFQKGHDLILRALPAILERFPRVVLVWAGDGEERARLEERIQAGGWSNAVRLLGWREDVPRLLAAADLFLFPTRFEGESFALMEAMAARVPIVAAAVSGIPELLRDGEDGRLFAPEDSAGLATAVLETLADPGAAALWARQAAHRLAAYTYEHMLEDTLSLLRNVATPADRRET